MSEKFPLNLAVRPTRAAAALAPVPISPVQSLDAMDKLVGLLLNDADMASMKKGERVTHLNADTAFPYLVHCHSAPRTHTFMRGWFKKVPTATYTGEAHFLSLVFNNISFLVEISPWGLNQARAVSAWALGDDKSMFDANAVSGAVWVRHGSGEGLVDVAKAHQAFVAHPKLATRKRDLMPGFKSVGIMSATGPASRELATMVHQTLSDVVLQHLPPALVDKLKIEALKKHR